MAKLFFLKAAKPLAFLAVGAYGLYEWNRALELKRKEKMSDIFGKIDELDGALNAANLRLSQSQSSRIEICEELIKKTDR